MSNLTSLFDAVRQQTIDLFLYLLLFSFFYWLFNNFIATLPVTPLDDTCVYFNYAKNIVDGNIFAYDARNLPSEGFTSLIFLLLLAAFQYVGINLLFAAIFINMIALTTIIWFGVKLYQAIAATENTLFTYLFMIIFAISLVFDQNIEIMIGMGFESMLSPALIFAAFYLLLISYQHQKNNLTIKSLNKSIVSSFILLFLAILIRPENLLIVGVFAMMGLVMISYQRAVIYGILAFGMCFTLYLLFKLIYFGDIFPTAYYRKLNSTGSFAGYYYVVNTLTYYLDNIFIITGLFISTIVLDRKRAMPYFLIFSLFSLTTLIITVFFLFVSPIVGYGGRFLVLPIVIIHFLLACFLALMLEKAINLNKSSQDTIITSKSLIILLPITAVLFIPIDRFSLNYFSTEPIRNFYQTVRQKFENHPYVKFGDFLKTQLPQPQQVTLVFGDAGCIPYTSNLRFIDPNGLTEPYIAHLFKISDKKQIVKPFTDYILQHHPDIIVIGYGRIENDGISLLVGNPHSPFGKAPQLAEFQAYRDDGFKYLCSLPNEAFDVHLAVRPESPQAAQVIPVLLEYCHASGYFLPNGLIKQNKEGQVYFPRYAE